MSVSILAVDPGTFESGYVVWNGQNVIEKGVITNESMLEAIPRLLDSGADTLALEMR